MPESCRTAETHCFVVQLVVLARALDGLLSALRGLALFGVRLALANFLRWGLRWRISSPAYKGEGAITV